MSQPADVSVVELEQIVEALVGLARDRGATPAQRELLGGIWVELRAATLSGTSPAGLHRRTTSLAADLLGMDALLAPENAPYGGFWQAVETETADPPSPIEIGAVGLTERRSELRAFLQREGVPSWEKLASRGLTLVPFTEACEAIEELARIVAPGPYLQTIALLPALPQQERERVAAGEASWALATGPLVVALDTATSIAMVGGDGIYELVGAERELLATRDPSRPLGVVTGGDAGRRLGDATSLPLVRRRLLTGLAFEALGVIDAVGQGPSSSAARALAVEAARRLEPGDPEADQLAAAAKALAADLAFELTGAPTARGAIAGSEPALLHERARAIRAWEASPAQLRAELGEALVNTGGEG